MSTYKVKELMVPLSEYATVQVGATLFEAVLALEKAQAEYDQNKHRHRAILVLDKKGRVVGKLNHMDVLKALDFEPIDQDAYKISDLSAFEFSDRFISKLINKLPLRDISLQDLCKKALKIKVEEIMQAPLEAEYVSPDTPLETAIHQMVVGQHSLSLLVGRDQEIVGILRLSDVFGAIFHTMKECEIG